MSDCDCDAAAEGTAPTATPTSDDTPLAHPGAARFDTVAVPVTGAYLVIDGVVTKDPTPEQVVAAFGCSMGCR